MRIHIDSKWFCYQLVSVMQVGHPDEDNDEFGRDDSVPGDVIDLSAEDTRSVGFGPNPILEEE